jgi:plastocyanin
MARAVTLITVLSALILGAGTASAAATHPTLIGTVGKNNAYKITMTDANGKLAKTLRAGTYTLAIHDDSTFHNYELDGPNGKSWTFTTVPFTGTKTLTLKLAPGEYKAYCAPHESTMFQHFTVS